MRLTTNHLLDRSRYACGFQCPRKRFLNYHAGESGLGYQHKTTKIPLARGIYIHEGLAIICKGLQDSGQANEVGDEFIRMAASFAVTEYRKELKRGYQDYPEEHLAFTINEQATLIEGLIWAWSRVMLPIIQAEFEVISVEQEELFPIPNSNIIIMSRPDIILRRKSDGKLGNHDFKTSSSTGDWWTSQWRDSVQMELGSMGAEQRLGEPIGHYYMHGLTTGKRHVFSAGGRNSPEERQYSRLCYARTYPPNPPQTTKTTWDYKGFWVDCNPIWEAEFTQKPADQTNVEFWVKEMPKSELDGLFTLAGPYYRQQGMKKHLLNEIKSNEHRWVDNLWTLWETQENKGDVDLLLDSLFPRSYRCWEYNSRCEFYGPCREGGNWDEFEERKPHHEAELEENVHAR